MPGRPANSANQVTMQKTCVVCRINHPQHRNLVSLSWRSLYARPTPSDETTAIRTADWGTRSGTRLSRGTADVRHVQLIPPLNVEHAGPRAVILQPLTKAPP